MSTTTVVERSSTPTLAELEETICRHHQACVEAAASLLGHAISAGEALLQVREKLMRDGTWTGWINGPTMPLARTQAYTYMRLARFQDQIPSSIDGIKQAEEFLAGLPGLSGGRSVPPLPDPIKDEARRQHAEGRGYAAIARDLGVSKSTVHYWLNGSKDATRMKEARAALREKEAAQRAKKIAARSGGALAEAYAMAERLDSVLGQVRGEVSDPEAKREISRAHDYQHAMRDAIVRALGAAG